MVLYKVYDEEVEIEESEDEKEDGAQHEHEDLADCPGRPCITQVVYIAHAFPYNMLVC